MTCTAAVPDAADDKARIRCWCDCIPNLEPTNEEQTEWQVSIHPSMRWAEGSSSGYKFNPIKNLERQRDKLARVLNKVTAHYGPDSEAFALAQEAFDEILNLQRELAALKGI